MYRGHRPVRARITPRAENPTILSNEVVEKTRSLLEQYGEIPLRLFATFWDIKYDEVIDFTGLANGGGLVGFLRANPHLFDLANSNSDSFVVSLIPRPESRDSSDGSVAAQENHLPRMIAKRRPVRRVIDLLFNEPSLEWDLPKNKNSHDVKDIYIKPSAYETALNVGGKRTRDTVKYLREILRRYPMGLEITKFYKHIHALEVLQTFSVSHTTSIVALVDELPEVFYREKAQDSGMDSDLIFDASTHTVSDLTGHDDKLFGGGLPPDGILNLAIKRGLYQKTLILLKETGQVKGLKINVWVGSLRESFYAKDENTFEEDMADINTLTYFLALARYGLVQLKSHDEIRNDIRVFFPLKSPNFSFLKSILNELNSRDSTSEDPEDTLGELPPNAQVCSILRNLTN